MNAKDLLFEEMGWTEDAGITDWLGKVGKGVKNFFGGGKGAKPSGDPKAPMTMAEHAKVCEANTPQRCPYAREAAEELAKKPENQGKSKEELLNEVWAEHEELRDKAKEEENKDASEGESPEDATEELDKPENADIAGVDFKLDTETQKAAALALEKILADPNTPEDQKAKMQAVLEALKQQLQQNKENLAPPPEETPPPEGEEAKVPEKETEAPAYEVEMESTLLEPMSDADYAVASQSEAIKDFKAQLNDFFDKGGREVDVSQWDPSSAYVRAINEVVAERQAAGQKVEEDFDKLDEIDFSEPEAEPAGEEGGEGAEAEGDEEAAQEREQQQQQSLNIIGKRDWTPKQRAALQEMAKKFGAAMEGIRQDVKEPEFARLLNDINHFKAVQRRWETTPNVSANRQALREAVIQPEMDKHVEKSSEERLLDTIHGLIQQDELVDAATSDALKIALGRVAGILGDPDATDKEKDKAIRDYQTLCKKYNLAKYINGEGASGKPSLPGYKEDGDQNHREGRATASDESEKDYHVDLSSVSDIESKNGTLNNTQVYIDKIASDIEKEDLLQGLVSAQDIKTTPLMAMTEFSFSVPEDITLTQAQGDALCQKISARFPIHDLKKGDEVVPQKATFNFDHATQTFTIAVENDKKGSISQKQLLQSKEFKDAIDAGGIPILVGVDKNQRPIIRDLTKMAHTLMVGATNAGKSVILNDIITGFLSQSPYNVKLGLIDLSGVEFPQYDGARHMTMPTAKTPEQANKLLNWYRNEMQARLDLLQKAQVKNIPEYNKLGEKGLLPEGMPKHLPFMPVIIDECSSLFEKGPHTAEITNTLNEMSRLARKTGIHFFFATQKGTSDFLPSSITSQATTRIGLAQKSLQNAKAFGTPDAVNIPTQSGSFQMNINGDLVSGTGGFLSPEGYSDLTQALVDAGNKLPPKETGSQPEPAEPKPTPEEVIDSLAKTPGMKNGLINIAERIATGDMRGFKLQSGEALEATKKFLESQGIPFDETPYGDTGLVVIKPKEPAQETPKEEAQSPTAALEEPAKGPTDSTSQTPAEGAGDGIREGAEGTEAPDTPSDNDSDGGDGGNNGGDSGGGNGSGGEGESGGSSSTGGSNPFLNEEELNGIENDRTRNRLRREANKLNQANAKLNELYTREANGEKVSDREIEQAEANVAAQYGKFNQIREEAGLPQYDIRTDKPIQPESTSEVPDGEGAGDGTNTAETSAQEGTTEKPLSRKDYEAKYPQTREGQLQRVRDERDAVLDAKWEELSASGMSPAQIKQDKGYQKLVNAYNAEEAEVKENFPEAEPVASEETGKATKSTGISIADDVSKLQGDDKLEYDAAVNSYNRGMENLREQLSSGEITRKEFREGKANLLKTLNEDRADLGFSTPVNADGAYNSIPEQGNEEQQSAEGVTEVDTQLVDAPEDEPSTREEADVENEEKKDIPVPQEGKNRVSKQRMDAIKGKALQSAQEIETAGLQSRNDEDLEPITPPAPTDAKNGNDTDEGEGSNPTDGGDGDGNNGNDNDSDGGDGGGGGSDGGDNGDGDGGTSITPASSSETPATEEQEEADKDAETSAQPDESNTTTVQAPEPSSEAQPAAPTSTEPTSQEPAGTETTETEPAPTQVKQAEQSDSTAEVSTGSTATNEQAEETQEKQSAEGGEKADSSQTSPYITAAIEKAGLSANAASEIQNDAGIQAAMKNLADAEQAHGKDSEEYKKAERSLKSKLTRFANAVKNREDGIDTDGRGNSIVANREQVQFLPKDQQLEKTTQTTKERNSDDTKGPPNPAQNSEKNDAIEPQKESTKKEAKSGKKAKSKTPPPGKAQEPNNEGGEESKPKSQGEGGVEKGESEPQASAITQASQEQPAEQKSTEPASEPAAKVSGRTTAVPANTNASTEPSDAISFAEMEQINDEIAHRFKTDKTYLEAKGKFEDIQRRKDKVEKELEKALKDNADKNKISALRAKLKNATKDLKDAASNVKSIEEGIQNLAYGSRGFTTEGERVPKDVLTATRMYQEGMQGAKEGAIIPVAMQQGKELVEAIQGKKTNRLLSLLSDIEGNRQGRKAFEAITGKELPKTSKETAKFIREFCGGDSATGTKSKAGSAAPAQKPKATPAKASETPASTTSSKEPQTTGSSTVASAKPAESKGGETPQMKAYRERKEAEEKAAQEKKAQQDAERARRLAEAQKRQTGRNDLNAQSKQYSEQVQSNAAKQSKGLQTLANIKPPQKIDFATAKDINSQLESVGEEIKRLSRSLNDDTVRTPEEEKAIAGTIERLRQGLKDIPQQQKLGKGNFSFAAETDANGHLMGLRITEYKGADGKMQSMSSPKKTDVSQMDKGEKISHMSRIIEKASLESPVRMTSTESRKMAESMMKAIDKKDKAGLMELCRIANQPGREAFSAITGVELPKDIKGTIKAIGDFCDSPSGGDGKGNDNPTPPPPPPEKKEEASVRSETEPNSAKEEVQADKKDKAEVKQQFGNADTDMQAFKKRQADRRARLDQEDDSQLGAGIMAQLKKQGKAAGKKKKGGKGGVAKDEALEYEYPDLWAAMNEVSPLEEESEEDVWADVYDAALASMGVEG